MNNKTIELTKEYMKERGQVYPDGESALKFAVTELGEVFDAILRKDERWVRNNDRSRDLEFEFADLYMMLSIACFEMTGVHVEDALAEKMKSKVGEQKWLEIVNRVYGAHEKVNTPEDASKDSIEETVMHDDPIAEEVVNQEEPPAVKRSIAGTSMRTKKGTLVTVIKELGAGQVLVSAIMQGKEVRCQVALESLIEEDS